MKTRTRKGLALLLSAAMIVSMLALPVLAEEQVASSFPDVAGHWAEGSIDRWAVYGIVKGDEYGKANPDSQLTRGELAQIFVNLFGLTTVAKNTYADLKGSEWYADAILKCTAAGIMQGDGTSSRASAPITRQEVMVMFGRAMGVIAPTDPDLSGFTDGDKVADWAAGYMAALAKLGIVTGSGDGSVAPVDNIDRASLLALLDKAVVEYVTEPGKANVNDANGFVIVNVPGEGTVTLTGTISGVVVAAGTRDAEVAASGLTAATVKVDSSAALSVDDASKLSNLTLNAPAPVEIARGSSIGTLAANAPAEIINNGSIATLTANAAVKMNNRGSIAKAQINADGVILDGTRPSSVVVAEGTKNPTDSNGKEIKPDGTGGGSPGGGDSPSVTYAELIPAILHDTRGDDANAEAGTYVPDGSIIAGFTVSNGALTTSGNNSSATITIRGTHLMQHQAGSDAGLGYWVGVGIPKAEGSEYAVGWGAAPATITDFEDAPDSEMTQNGKNYDTFYFGLASDKKLGYIAVKNGEKTTVYTIDFTNVELAPDVENLKVAVATEENWETVIPQAYLDEYEGEPGGLPWLVVTYTSNVVTNPDFHATKGGESVGLPPLTISGIGNHYAMYELEKDLIIEPDDQAGTYRFTIGTASATYIHNPDSLPTFTVTFMSNGVEVEKQEVLRDEKIVEPVAPIRIGYIFGGWYKEEAATQEWDFAADTVAGATSLYAKWTANSYAIAFDGNSANVSGTMAPLAAIYDVEIALTENGYTRIGYTFKGWNTKADGTGTAYADKAQVKNLTTAPDSTVTLYAQWEVTPVIDEETLKDALKSDIEKITISGTIGSTEKYEVYTVDRAVTIKGGTVYGSFVVNADDVTFDGVTINNKGDGAGGAHRNGINAYASRLSVKNCTFNSGTEFANGLMILPKTAETVYSITNNTFNGYANGDGSWSTSAILISSGYSMEQKPFFGAEAGAVSAATNLDNTADLNIIQDNFFNHCQNDYTRNDYTDGTVIYCTSNSASDNFRLSSGAAGSKFYVTGNVTRNTDTTVPEGAELVVTEGKTLTIPEGVTLTVEGTLTVNGTLVVNGTLTVTDTGTLNGTGTFPNP
jgi:uncharacterized repeat protein (TIGR02543 family)